MIRTLTRIVISLAVLAFAAPAHAVSWDRTFGRDVIDDAPNGAEICLVASHCKAGATGDAEGMFESVDGIASDGQNVYVVDRLDDRVSKFDANGNFLRMWGKGVNGGAGFEVCTSSCQSGQPGDAAGELSGPRDIAVSRTGGVYVADFNNRRIDEFTSDGTFVRAWGQDVGPSGAELCTTSCAQGALTAGQGDGFEGPNAVAVSDAGDVYVVDETAARVQKFDADGSFVFAIGKSVVTAGGSGGPENCTAAASCKLGSVGALGGEFDSPTGVAADTDGVWVTDESNQRLDKFDSAGGFVFGVGGNVNSGAGSTDRCDTSADCIAGSTDGAGGHFDNPSAVATDFHSGIYVADGNASRVQRLDSSGVFQVAFGKGVNGGPGFEECTVAANCLGGVSGSLGGEFDIPNALASDGNGSVFVGEDSSLRADKFIDGAVPVPQIHSIAPASIANDNAPRLIGSSAPGTTVRVFPDATCTGTPVTGSAADFASPGIAAQVVDNSFTTFSANATNGTFDSPCSATVTYTEDSGAPDTVLDSGPKGSIQDATPTFTFHASETSATLECRFDEQPFSACVSPLTPLLPLGAGSHVFEVRALDAVGNADPTPARARFAIGLPPPIEGRVVNAVPLKGTVLVKVKGNGRPKAHATAAGFVRLEDVGRQVPVGSTFNTKKGTVQLTAATGAKGATQTGEFSKGLFQFGQKKKNPLTTVSMTGGGLSACSKLPSGGSRKVVAARRRHRSLFSNVHGRFRTRGRNSTATVRGTKWTMTDTCKGTRTTVKRGSVLVHDLTKNRNRLVRAGHSYFARAPLAKHRRRR